jgi:hypothetical protein
VLNRLAKELDQSPQQTYMVYWFDKTFEECQTVELLPILVSFLAWSVLFVINNFNHSIIDHEGDTIGNEGSEAASWRQIVTQIRNVTNLAGNHGDMTGFRFTCCSLLHAS